MKVMYYFRHSEWGTMDRGSGEKKRCGSEGEKVAEITKGEEKTAQAGKGANRKCIGGK